jgi:hypothetical protein
MVAEIRDGCRQMCKSVSRDRNQASISAGDKNFLKLDIPLRLRNSHILLGCFNKGKKGVSRERIKQRNREKVDA